MSVHDTPPPPAEAEDHYRGYPLTLLIGFDSFVNIICGGRFGDTISARTGRSIAFGGWASRMRWPHWWRKHCYWAASLTLPNS